MSSFEISVVMLVLLALGILAEWLFERRWPTSTRDWDDFPVESERFGSARFGWRERK